MFEEIKDYQGRDLNTAFPPDHLEGELKADKIFIFISRERT